MFKGIGIDPVEFDGTGLPEIFLNISSTYFGEVCELGDTVPCFCGRERNCKNDCSGYSSCSVVPGGNDEEENGPKSAKVPAGKI